jgi:protein AATF/BFR2
MQQTKTVLIKLHRRGPPADAAHQQTRPTTMPRKSLSEQIAEFSDPTPRNFDPEALTTFGDDTASTASGGIARDHYGDGGASHNMADGRLTLRAEPDVLDDPKYAGVAVSRRALRDSSDSGSATGSDSGGGSSDSSGSGSDSSSDSDSELAPTHFAEDPPSEDELDRQLDLVARRDGKRNPSDNSDIARRNGSEGRSDDNTPASDTVRRFREKEKQRAEHTLNQKKFWADLLEVRMRMQPLLELGNRLPEVGAHALFHDHSDENLEAFESVVDTLSVLVRECIGLKKALSERHPDVAALKPVRKRKRLEGVDNTVEDLWDEIKTGHDNFRPYRNAVISRWNKKTQLQAGMALHKKFKVVNQGILSQINSVLADQGRLKKRTWVRRMTGSSIGRALGEAAGSGGDRGGLPERHDDEPASEDMELNSEIFDDTDFFKVLRQEYLESTMSTDDLLAASKAFALQSRQTKKKKKIDTRATKGRRLRYVVMPKLLNFMAPEYVPAPPIDVDVLLSSLFR